MKLGLEQVTQEKVDELEAHIDDIDFAYDIADYIYILHNGIILKKGSRDEIFEDFEFFKKLNFNIPNKLKIKKFLNKKDINIEEYDKFLKENF